ncbi:YeeE/YedE family protein [Flagellatimonas centrodinii]|uniref:DUF6691 family protein n=1 Tax=Flagellatimonas centrodinii TaxID=2806210 RepID=UPI001FED4B2D|nr:DUF6691 family protein [Flagellatimonas centrodinii]ULQ46607.1 YeeE/YedE family protein [Flagellatimonas centrodinii]
MRALIAVLVGMLFGFGLSLSGMTEPLRVLGFLDLAGQWDPTLGFVMGGALMVTLPGFWLARRRGRPILDSGFQLPTRRDLDRRLIIGTGLFGIGWGIAGFCPGPAIASLSSGLPMVLAFAAAMAVGMLVHDRLLNR